MPKPWPFEVLIIPAPGDTGGPCPQSCPHAKCGQLIALAAESCQWCHKPYGYGAPLTVEGGGHATCALAAVEEETRKMDAVGAAAGLGRIRATIRPQQCPTCQASEFRVDFADFGGGVELVLVTCSGCGNAAGLVGRTGGSWEGLEVMPIPPKGRHLHLIPGGDGQ